MKHVQEKVAVCRSCCVSALGVTGAAQAVNVNPEGLGQVLIYPYLHHPRRTTSATRTAPCFRLSTRPPRPRPVKVRFLEGKEQPRSADFKPVPSKKDVWTAAILADADTGGARVLTADRSCTLPGKEAWTSLGGNVYAQSFFNYAYTATRRQGWRFARPVEGRLCRNHRDGHLRFGQRNMGRGHPRQRRAAVRGPDRGDCR